MKSSSTSSNPSWNDGSGRGSGRDGARDVDDEALARMLQFEEQANARSILMMESDSNHRLVQQGVALSDQELADMVLAREMAEMELGAGSGTAAAQRPASIDHVAAGSGPPARMYTPFASDTTMLLSKNTTAATTTAAARGTGQMAFAEQLELQEQAYQQSQRQRQQQGQKQDYYEPSSRHNRKQNSLEIPPPYYQYSEETGLMTRVQKQQHQQEQQLQQFQDDFELALLMQQEEEAIGIATADINQAAAAAAAAAINGDYRSLAAAKDDERLAMLMASTGRSLRDLTQDEITNLLEGATSVPPKSVRRSRQTGEVAATAMARLHHGQPKTTGGSFSSPSSPPNAGRSQLSVPKPPEIYRSDPTSPTPQRAFMHQQQQQQQQRQPQPQPQVARPVTGIPPSPSLLLHGGIPSAIPPPPRGLTPNHPPCYKCGLFDGTFLKAKDFYYHPECFRCAACHETIDLHSPFGFRNKPLPGNRDGNRSSSSSSSSTTSTATKEPYHAHCLPYSKSELCVVCQKPLIPRPGSGTAAAPVCFVKHPFFSSERMCPEHADALAAGNSSSAKVLSRRCTSCHRFEPWHDPFADLDDGTRCVCFACCRTVIIDGNDSLILLWQQVVHFFEHQMKLPVWDEFREMPVFSVGIRELSEYQRATPPGGCYCSQFSNSTTQVMTRGLCLTTAQENGQRLKTPSMRFNRSSSSSFEALDADSTGYTSSSNAKLFAIMVLSGLPRDLTTSILVHQATHAWIQLHPDCHTYPLPDPQVEEGVAQLVAMLFLNEGLDPPEPLGSGDTGPSDEQLREYFRFCIEMDDSEIYGKGYQKAAKAYEEVGIQALLTHIVLVGTFPAL